MKPEELNEIERVTLESSPCDWYAEVAAEVGGPGLTDPKVIADEFRRCLENDPAGRPTFCVGLVETSLKAPTIAAFTGNGPTSEANAKFFAGARRVILALVEECRELELKRDEAATGLRVYEEHACDLWNALSEYGELVEGESPHDAIHRIFGPPKCPRCKGEGKVLSQGGQWCRCSTCHGSGREDPE